MTLRCLALAAALALPAPAALATSTEVIISIREQTLSVIQGKRRAAHYPVSTSRFGVGDSRGSFRTPLGVFRVDRKVGGGARPGAVFKGLRPTGEVVGPNSAGRDPIVTRVLCLRGVEGHNGNARARGIFIHGTPEEKSIGRPASFGCIRMRSSDVIALYDTVPVGSRVLITDGSAPAPGTDSRGHENVDWFR